MSRFYNKISTLALALSFLFALPHMSEAQNQKAPMWSYQGDNGPTSWAELSTDYAACRGPRQSPINLRNADREKKPSLKIEYGTSKATVVNRKRATQVNTTGGKLTLNSNAYRLRQLHLHTPAEHTVRGNRRAAEIHLVHQAQNQNQLVVIALPVRQGQRNPALNRMVDGAERGYQKVISNYNVRELFPEGWRSSYYRYRGSLTAPPCTENVRWVVLTTAITASKEQIKALRARHGESNRPIQPRNDRDLWRVSRE